MIRHRYVPVLRCDAMNMHIVFDVIVIVDSHSPSNKYFVVATVSAKTPYESDMWHRRHLLLTTYKFFRFVCTAFCVKINFRCPLHWTLNTLSTYRFTHRFTQIHLDNDVSSCAKTFVPWPVIDWISKLFYIIFQWQTFAVIQWTRFINRDLLSYTHFETFNFRKMIDRSIRKFSEFN